MYPFAVAQGVSLPQIQMTKMNPKIKRRTCSRSNSISLQNVFSLHFAFYLVTCLIQWSHDTCVPFSRRGERGILNVSALKVFRNVSSHVTYDHFKNILQSIFAFLKK